MGGSSAPEPPDYVGAAQAQGQSNLEAAIATGKINNPNINNPYGTQVVTWNGQQPTIVQKLAPEQQRIFDAQNIAKQTLSETGAAAAQNVKGSLSNPVNFSGVGPSLNDAEKSRSDVINAMMARVDTDTAGQRQAKNSELIAAGIRPGTTAYDNAMGLIDRQYNDARQQAISAGTQAAQADFGINQQARNQAIFELLQQRQVPLNEINALLSGSQVSSPFSGSLGYQPGASVQAAPIANAVNQQGQAQQNAYNQSQATNNANLAAGAGLIGSLGSGYLYG